MTAVLPTSGRWTADTISDAYDIDFDTGIAVKANLDAAHNRAGVTPDVFFFNTVDVDGDVLVFDADTYPHATDPVIGFTPVAVWMPA